MEDSALEHWGGRDEKAAHNQSLFRMVNEQIRRLHADKGLSDDFGPLAPIEEWVCECANAACMERITLSEDEYAVVRAIGSRFAIFPGEAHFFEDVEDVTERQPGYWVVEKTGRAKEIAETFYERDGHQ
jgi:hypothetical protein